MPCPLCESTDYNILFNDKDRRGNVNYVGTYVQCQECSLVYLQERPSWQELAKFYSCLSKTQTAKSHGHLNREFQQRREGGGSKWKRLFYRIRRRPHSWPLGNGNGKQLLDIGCGSGEKLLEFADRGYSIWGVDIDAGALEAAQRLIPSGRFLHGKIEDLSLTYDFFDIVRLDNCLEHILDLQKLLNQIIQLLKVGGVCYIYVPHAESLSVRLLRRYSVSFWVPFHLQLFSSRNLIKLLLDTGFSGVKLYHYCPPTWIVDGLMQAIAETKSKIKMNQRTRNLIAFIFRPLGLLACKLSLGEELIAVAWK